MLKLIPQEKKFQGLENEIFFDITAVDSSFIFAQSVILKGVTMKLAYTALLVSALLVGCSSPSNKNGGMKENELEKVTIKVANETVQGGYKLVSLSDVKKMLDAKEAVLLVDTMPSSAYKNGFIPTAKNFAFEAKYSGDWEKDSLGGTQEQFKALLGSDLNAKIVFYCGFNLCARSDNGARWAQQLGYTNVERMPGGINGWKDAGYDVAK